MLDLSRRFLLEDAWFAAMRLGLRRVGFAEFLDEAQCASGEARVRAALGGEVRFVRRPLAGEPGRFDLVYGASEADVREAAAACDALDRPAGREMSGTIRRIGALLGYPACCVEAFLARGAVEMERLGRAYHRLRREDPGPIDPRMNPFTGVKLYHLPCSLRCQATLRQSAAVLDALVEDAGPAAREALLDEASLAAVYRLDHFPAFAAVRPLGPVEADGFAYRPEGVFDFTGTLAPVLAGDRVRLAGGRIEVLSGDRVVASLGPDAAVWWHGRAVGA